MLGYKYLLGESYAELQDTVNPIKLATESAPPAFIWHTETDATVSVSSTLRYAARLHEVGTRTELHVYPEGGHGLGLALKFPSVNRWTRELLSWLERSEDR